jgi:transposase InsO family protein
VGHIGNEGVKRLTSAVDGITCKEGDVPFCKICAKAKIQRLPFPKSTENRAEIPLERIHTDICGLINHGYKNFKYFITFIDDFSRFAYVFPMWLRSEAIHYFKIYKNLVENQQNVKIKILRSNNAPEYKEGDFKRFLIESGIRHEFTAPYSPQQNGVAECYNCTLTEMARSMLIDAKLPGFFWNFAVEWANHIKNRVTHKALPPSTTPYQLFTGKRPNISYFHPFGAHCFSKIMTPTWKFEEKAEEGFYLGYSPSSKAHIFWDKRGCTPQTRRDLIFSESDPGKLPASVGEEQTSDISLDVYTPLFEDPVRELSEDADNPKGGQMRRWEPPYLIILMTHKPSVNPPMVSVNPQTITIGNWGGITQTNE